MKGELFQVMTLNLSRTVAALAEYDAYQLTDPSKNTQKSVLAWLAGKENNY